MMGKILYLTLAAPLTSAAAGNCSDYRTNWGNWAQALTGKQAAATLSDCCNLCNGTFLELHESILLRYSVDCAKSNAGRREHG